MRIFSYQRSPPTARLRLKGEVWARVTVKLGKETLRVESWVRWAMLAVADTLHLAGRAPGEVDGAGLGVLGEGVGVVGVEVVAGVA